MSSSNQVVKVKRERIAACMTCPLCNKLLRDATTISECLHTFCRRCIYKKLSKEESECCPVCSIDLGCIPLEKLRPDHNLQDLRAKIFPSKRRKLKAPEAVPSITLPVRRKERSLSSLVVSTPRVSTQATMIEKRAKAVARRAAALRGSSFTIEKPIMKEEDYVEDRPESSSSPETLNKFIQNARQNFPATEPSSPVLKEEMKNNAEAWEGKLDLWKPLNCLVEVANRTKSFKLNSHGSAAKSEPICVPDREAQVCKTKVKEQGRKSNIQDEKNCHPPLFQESIKPKKPRRIHRKKAAAFGESGIPPRAVLDVGAKCERRTGPIWFCLVASEDQEGEEPLQQIPANYLRIKDGNIPVFLIQKYLMRKLDLTSEAEVEIKCMGQPVLPTLELHNLVALWLQAALTPQRIQASVGASAKDFILVLAYARRIPDP